VAFGRKRALPGFHPSGAYAAHPHPMQAPSAEAPVTNPHFGLRARGSLATLYAWSRPAMLSRRCITATAGTSLVRDSLAGVRYATTPRRATAHSYPRENASSNFRSLTKIPHCCLRRGYFKPQVAGRPLSPARDRRLGPTPNPTQPHPVSALGLSSARELPHRGAHRPARHALRTLLPRPTRAPVGSQTSMCQASRAHSPRAIVKLT